jgi:ribosomal protein L7/L12
MVMTNQEQLIDKFTKLRFRISFSAKESHILGELEVINDMDWVKRKIEDFEAGRVPDKIDLGTANRLWKQYSLVGLDMDEKTMWELIDSTLEAGNKIASIKLHRKFTGSGLREAKNVIDAREMKNKGLI